MFSSASQTIIVTPILPLIGGALDVEPSRLGLLVTAYSLMLAASALVMGPVSDRFGRRRVLLMGAGTLVVALGLHGLAASFEALVAVRVLAGAGGGMLSGAAVSYVGDYFPYARRGWATGLVMSGVPFGLVLGIPIGRVLAVAYGFRAPFLVFAALMAVAFALTLALVPQPDVEREGRLSLRDTLLRYPRLLGQRDALAASATYFLMYFGLSLLVVYLPQWLTERFPLAVALFGRPLRLFGLDVDFIATLFLAGGAASVLTSPLAGTVSDRIGRKPLILASCVGFALATAAFTYVAAARWVVYVGYVALLVLFSMRMTPLQALLTALVPDRQRGSLLAVTIAIGQIGTALGAALAGTLYAGPGYRVSTFASAAVALGMALVVWRALPEPAGERENGRVGERERTAAP